MSHHRAWDSGGLFCGRKDGDDLALFEALRGRKDDELALFEAVRSRERHNFLHPSNEEDIAASLSTAEFGGLSGYLYPAASTSLYKGTNDLLSSDGEKNDYDWLLTPPATPLFPSLDRDSSKLLASQGGILLASRTSSLSSCSHEAFPKILRQNPHRRRRPSTSSSTTSSTNSASRRVSSPSLSPSFCSPLSAPSGRPSPPSKQLSSTIRRNQVTRSSMPTLPQHTNNIITPIDRFQAAGKAVSRNRRKSQSPRLSSPGFCAETPPPNLRTSISITDFSTTTNRHGHGRTASFDTPEVNRRKRQTVRDKNSSQISKGSVSSSFDDENIKISPPDGLDADCVFADSSVSPRVIKRQTKSNESTVHNTTLVGLSSKKYCGPTMRQANHERNSQNMFRPLLSSVPTSSFYSIRLSNAHHMESSLHHNIENTEDKAAQMMGSISHKNSGKKLAVEESEEEQGSCAKAKLLSADLTNLDFETSSHTQVSNSCECVGNREIKELDSTDLSIDWKPEVSITETVNKKDSVFDEAMDIDIVQDVDKREELFRDIIEDFCGQSFAMPCENFQDIKTSKENGSFQCFYKSPEADVPTQSKPYGYLCKESLDREPQRVTYHHHEPHTVVNSSISESHLSNQRGGHYQEGIKYHSTSHQISNSNSFNSSKEYDFHIQEDRVDLANRPRPLSKSVSTAVTSNVRSSSDAVDKELFAFIPLNQHMGADSDEQGKSAGPEVVMSILQERKSLHENQSEISSEGSCSGCFMDIQEIAITTDPFCFEISRPGNNISSFISLSEDSPIGSAKCSSKWAGLRSSQEMEDHPMDVTLISAVPVEQEVSNNKHVAMDVEPTYIADLSLSQPVDGINEHGKGSSMNFNINGEEPSYSKEVEFCVMTLGCSSQTPDHDNLHVVQDTVPGGSDVNGKSPLRARTLLRSATLEEETTESVLFCRSIVHDIMHMATSIAMEKEHSATPIQTGKHISFVSDRVFTFMPRKRKGQNMVMSSLVHRTKTYKQNQRASLSSITVQQSPMDKTGSTIIGDEEEPVILTPVREFEDDKLNNKKIGCRCSCTIL